MSLRKVPEVDDPLRNEFQVLIAYVSRSKAVNIS